MDLSLMRNHTAKEWISELIDDGYTWRKIADEIGLSAALVWRFYHRGWEPKDNEKRRKLGLPHICRRCGYKDGEEIT